MRFVILGAGALGTILGAHLIRAKHEVVVVARGERAKSAARDGLIVHGLAELRERCKVVTDTAKVRDTDCLIVATKATDTLPSLRALAHMRLSTVFSMQNGVVKDELLGQVFPPETVIGSMADFSGELLASGEVLFTRNVGLDLGEVEGGISERVANLAKTIDSAGVRCTAVADIKTREWSKFVAWAGLVPLAGLTRLNTWRYLVDENGAWIAVRLVREVAQLAKALNIPLMDLSPLPAVTISTSSDRDAIAAVQDVGRRFQENAPDHRMSTLQDIDRGTAIEIEETLGYAVEKAKALSLPMPTLELCYGLLRVGKTGGRGSGIAGRDS